MAGKREKPEEIVSKLRQVEVLQGQGATVAEAVRQIGVTQQTFYRWHEEEPWPQWGRVSPTNFMAGCSGHNSSV